MKRHESLAPLSREHHKALILAQLLKKDAPDYKGLPTEPQDKLVYAIGLFNESLKEHFKKEEILIGRVEHCHEDIKQLGKDIKSEHQQFTECFMGLDKVENLADSMDALGRGLEMHIRKEERVLFPLIQKHCPEELLNEIASLLH
ncbi:MAG: hemerythrin domain-containing protein [Ferruginibacter sp.]